MRSLTSLLRITLLIPLFPIALSAAPTLLERVDEASRELEVLLNLAASSDGSSGSDRATLLGKEGDFEKKFADVMNTLGGAEDDEGLRAIRRKFYQDVVRSFPRVESLEVKRLELRLRFEKPRLRLASKEPEGPYAELQAIRRKLERLERSLVEAHYLALQRKYADQQIRNSRDALKSETLRLEGELSRLQGVMAAEVLQGAVPAEGLRRLLLEEQLHWTARMLRRLRSDLEREQMRQQLAALEVSRGEILAVRLKVKDRLHDLERETEALARKRGEFENLRRRIREEATLSTQPELPTALGTPLELRPNMEEQLALGQRLIDLLQGAEAALGSETEQMKEIAFLAERQWRGTGETGLDELRHLARHAWQWTRQAIQTVFRFVNSLIPKRESSRPKPERLIPPKGSLGSDRVIPLMKTDPASRVRVHLSAFLRSRVQRLAPSP